MVIYQCDQVKGDHLELSRWTCLCLRQADLVLDLAMGSSAEVAKSQEVTGAERLLEVAAKRTRKELVLLHGEDVKSPKDTRLLS